MKLTVLSLLLAMLVMPARADETWREDSADAAELTKLYGSSADAISLDEARKLMLELVNAERSKAGVQPVELSEAASRLAWQHADEMARERYLNHADLAGHKCELRFNELGEVDNVAENISYYEIDAAVALTPTLMRRIHSHWMESANHRSNVLDVAHNRLGFSLKLVRAGKQTIVAAAEEFVSDYGEYNRLPAEARLGQRLELYGRLDPEVKLLFIGVASENLPRARTPEEQMRHTGVYVSPSPTLALVPESYQGRYTPNVTQYRYDVNYDPATGDFSAIIPLESSWPTGAYYVTAWVQSEQLGVFRAMAQVVLVR